MWNGRLLLNRSSRRDPYIRSVGEEVLQHTMVPQHLIIVIMALLVTPLTPSTDGAIIDSRRQVLPPMPGYIPVYIQHGDVPPEDPHEYAGLFQVADQNVPPRVSVTMPVITTEAAPADEARTTNHDATTEQDNVTDNKMDTQSDDSV